MQSGNWRERLRSVKTCEGLVNSVEELRIKGVDWTNARQLFSSSSSSAGMYLVLFVVLMSRHKITSYGQMLQPLILIFLCRFQRHSELFHSSAAVAENSCSSATENLVRRCSFLSPVFFSPSELLLGRYDTPVFNFHDSYRKGVSDCVIALSSAVVNYRVKNIRN